MSTITHHAQAVEVRVSASSMPNERITGEPVFDDHGNPAQPSNACVYKPSVSIPTMLVPRELNYLHWLARGLTGHGRAVELGPFLGGSTGALVAGMRANPAAAGPLLTYDAFEIAADIAAWGRRLLDQYGLVPGQRFREMFDHNLRLASDMFSVRDNWLPPQAGSDQEADIYPEQEPIELLFIDIAKTWEVNLTVLRTFGRHLFPGATVVQQDFFDLPTPWIALHAYQLREVLEPLDALHRTPTVSFRCVGSVADHLERLWTREDLSDPQARRDAWRDVRAYWSGILGTDRSGIFEGHAAMHALMNNDVDDFVRHGRRYEAWTRSAHSDTMYCMPAWPDLLSSLPDELRDRRIESKDAVLLTAECTARGQRADRLTPNERNGFCPMPQRPHVWNAAIERLRKLDHQRIALLGAGQHTRWLLEEFAIEHKMQVACILDDDFASGNLLGLPVVRPAHTGAHLDLVTAILPSSDSIEEQLVSRLDELFADHPGIHIERVYTHPDVAESLKTNWQYQIKAVAEHERGPLLPPAPDDPPVSVEATHRAQLCLENHRPWADALTNRYRLPRWTKGYLRMHEAAFLWDFIEAEQPRNIVEIGTASGVSTSMLLHGAQLLSSPDSVIHSFDILSHCYFDPARLTGEAIGEMAPELVNRAYLSTRADAIDAAASFGIGEIDLLFIDAEHAHPAPTIDMICLLYAVRPGSWIILHDIELNNIDPAPNRERWHHTGAARLFQQWPWEKIQPAGDSPADRNIGAIRMPQDPAQAVRPLLSILEGPWEMKGPAMTQVHQALRLIHG